MYDSRFTTSSTKECGNMNDNLQRSNLKGDAYNEVKRNNIHMDVNIGMEPSTDLQHKQKYIFIDGKDNDDPINDIAKFFGSPTMLSEFSVYVIPHHLSSTIFKKRRQIKKSRILQDPFTDPTKRKKLRKEIDHSSTSFNPLRSISKEAL